MLQEAELRQSKELRQASSGSLPQKQQTKAADVTARLRAQDATRQEGLRQAQEASARRTSSPAAARSMFNYVPDVDFDDSSAAEMAKAATMQYEEDAETDVAQKASAQLASAQLLKNLAAQKAGSEADAAQTVEEAGAEADTAATYDEAQAESAAAFLHHLDDDAVLAARSREAV